jgi:hypothetical protein
MWPTGPLDTDGNLPLAPAHSVPAHLRTIRVNTGVLLATTSTLALAQHRASLPHLSCFPCHVGSMPLSKCRTERLQERVRACVRGHEKDVAAVGTTRQQPLCHQLALRASSASVRDGNRPIASSRNNSAFPGARVASKCDRPSTSSIPQRRAQ